MILNWSLAIAYPLNYCNIGTYGWLEVSDYNDYNAVQIYLAVYTPLTYVAKACVWIFLIDVTFCKYEMSIYNKRIHWMKWLVTQSHNANCVTRVGGPLRWGTTVYPGLRWGTNELGDQWEHGRKGNTGGLMRWGTNDNMVERATKEDQWDGRPMRTVYPGLRWGTNEMDQWEQSKKG